MSRPNRSAAITVKSLLTLAKSFGVTRMKVGDIEFELGPVTVQPEVHEMILPNKRMARENYVEPEPTYEELLFHSAPALPNQDEDESWQTSQ